jgi:hypothetical protein
MTNDARYTCENEARISMAEAALNKKENLST